MPARLTHDELLRRKRELHLRIGRSRRRIDGRLRATKDRTRELLSWRTYVVRYPGWALMAALGAGMAASTAFRPARISRWLGVTLASQAFGGIQRQLASELQRLWTDWTDQPPARDLAMSDPTKRPLFADLRRECGGLGAELCEMLAARWELARLEIAADLRSARQLLVAWLTAIVLAIAALPVLVVCLAEVLDGRAGIHREGWLLIFGGGLLLLAVAGSYFAWRRFRRKFIGLRETLEELHEDVLWLQEQSGGRTAEGGDENRPD